MIDFEKGIINRGNWHKIRSCMDRAAAGESLTLGFLGGSITQGSLASVPEKCYAYLVFSWWKEKFPKANLIFVNAGIGGTTSQFGAARVEEDLLNRRPDFVLTEFSVNDEANAHFQETYEGLTRKIIKSGCGLMLMSNVCYDSGHSAEEQHLAVARHYRLPMVSMKTTVYGALVRGDLKNRDITPDDLHPNDAGHALVAKVIIHLLEKIRTAPREEKPDDLPAPMTPNRYEGSRRYRNHNSRPAVKGFVPDETPQNHITECFRMGYTAWKRGDSITFSVRGSCIAVQYRKSVTKPTPIARVTVDGAHEMLLDGNFQETWGDCLYLDTVAEDLEDKEHLVTVEITEAHGNDKVPFYLVSVIGS